MGEDTREIGKVIQIDEGKVREHLSEMVRGSVEETLNTMLQAEADQLCQAKRYERTDARQDTRARTPAPGHYERKLHTKAGFVDVLVQGEAGDRAQLKVDDTAKPACSLGGRKPVEEIGWAE